MEPLSNSGGIGAQGPGRLVNPMLPQGVNISSSTYILSGDLLAMISRASQAVLLLGSNFSSSPGSGIQVPSANGQLATIGLVNDGVAFDMKDFPQLITRQTSGGGLQVFSSHLNLENGAADAVKDHARHAKSCPSDTELPLSSKRPPRWNCIASRFKNPHYPQHPSSEWATAGTPKNSAVKPSGKPGKHRTRRQCEPLLHRQRVDVLQTSEAKSQIEAESESDDLEPYCEAPTQVATNSSLCFSST
ncbi:hypothetical protein AXG93_2015s1390 [Marchantia polymorpha subsp. ruderalis]|uniref:Uncharacterized protein n=1 Tax=Marchantia polymorpha subsp. ruderalis TaxID=1480154 RepID=A0A176W2Z8_MARPO|nr:hypothetical protein AXG93_2015s1390 [Marchantia polymorpha subsp. ruderalis]